MSFNVKKVVINDTSDGLEAGCGVVLLMASIIHDTIESKDYKYLKQHVSMLTASISTLNMFIDTLYNHDSDCSTHNEPADKNIICECSEAKNVNKSGSQPESLMTLISNLNSVGAVILSLDYEKKIGLVQQPDGGQNYIRYISEHDRWV